MLERAESVGGWCRVESQPGRTKVQVWMPRTLAGEIPATEKQSSQTAFAQDVDDVMTARGLTPREIEVAHLLAMGNTNAEIAANLHLSVRTIEHHRASVLRKMGVQRGPSWSRG